MNRDDSAVQYRRLRAPSDHGGRLIDPPLSDVATQLSSTLQSADHRETDLQGRSLGSLSDEARTDALSAAIAYTSRYRTVAKLSRDPTAPIVMTGHQPELYHPGVWFKNFILDRLARERQAIGINLLIDSDTIGQAAIRVPSGTVEKPVVERVMFDRTREEIPFEERPLIDSALFRTFPDRVRGQLVRSVERPLVEQLWPEANSAIQWRQNLGACLSQARHQLEASWGLKTLELPISLVCDSAPFRWFATTVLAQLPRFQKIYNESLWEYRRANRVRSKTHPVPPLALDGEWLEAPFWVWSRDYPTRRRLFVKSVHNGIEITDRHSVRHHVSVSSNGSCEVGVEQLRQLSDQGIRLRSRALMTTMFARLFLCDLFIHGIGGAKYDQLTDVITQRFFGISAPDFLTVTATAKLPIQHRAVTDDEIRSIQLELRELRFNPQRSLLSSPEASALVDVKRQLISTNPRGVERARRHFQIAQINEAMQPMIKLKKAKLLSERTQMRELARIHRLLGSREYSFCLFPEATLRPLLLDN